MKILLLLVGFLSVCVAQESYTEDTDNGTVAIGQELSKINGKHSELVEKFQIQNANLLTDKYFRSYNFAAGLLSRNKWSVPTASKSLRRLLLWRSSNHIPELGNSDVDAELLKFFPYSITIAPDATKDGCPLIVPIGGKWLLADFIEYHDYVRDAIKLFVEFTTQMFEKSRMAVMNSTCDQGLYVIDGRGLAIKNFAEPNAFSALIHFVTTYEHYYPNLYTKVVVVNGNRNFVTLFNLLLPYLGETSKDLALFMEEQSDQAREFLRSYLDDDQVERLLKTT